MGEKNEQFNTADQATVACQVSVDANLAIHPVSLSENCTIFYIWRESRKLVAKEVTADPSKHRDTGRLINVAPRKMFAARDEIKLIAEQSVTSIQDHVENES